MFLPQCHAHFYLPCEVFCMQYLRRCVTVRIPESALVLVVNNCSPGHRIRHVQPTRIVASNSRIQPRQALPLGESCSFCRHFF